MKHTIETRFSPGDRIKLDGDEWTVRGIRHRVSGESEATLYDLGSAINVITRYVEEVDREAVLVPKPMRWVNHYPDGRVGFPHESREAADRAADPDREAVAIRYSDRSWTIEDVRS